MKNTYIKIFIFFLFIISYDCCAQLLDSVTLARQIEYTDLALALKNPEKVYKLNLRKTKLKKVPNEVYTLINLQVLNISKNKLVEIPKEIIALKNLEVLDVSANDIDTLYPEIGQLVNIRKLILNQNVIAHLPSTIGNLTKMTFLDLWGNYIQVFPQEITKLQNTLKVIDLRVISINDDRQEEIMKLLPNTKFFFSLSCNCN